MTIIIVLKKEIKFLATKKHFVINVTGGTNMMAVGSMVAASQLQSSAYYVLDNRFLPNEDTYLREIHIPDFKTESPFKSHRKNRFFPEWIFTFGCGKNECQDADENTKNNGIICEKRCVH